MLVLLLAGLAATTAHANYPPKVIWAAHAYYSNTTHDNPDTACAVVIARDKSPDAYDHKVPNHYQEHPGVNAGMVDYWDCYARRADGSVYQYGMALAYGLCNGQDGGGGDRAYYTCLGTAPPDWKPSPPPPTKAPGPCGGQTPCQQSSNHPINFGAANKYLVENDYIGAGAYPLLLTRYYNSSAGSAAPSLANNMGIRWRHTYDRTIQVMPSPPARVVASRPDGKVYLFTWSGTVWQPDGDVVDRLVRLTDASGNTTGWRYTNSDDETEAFDAAGQLTSITNRAGLTQTLTYNAQGRLQTVSDPFGRTLTFTYDASGRVYTLNATGAIFTYTYNTAGMLATVIYPDTKSRTYLYETPTDRFWLLVGINDENASRYSTYAYDAAYRPKESGLAGGVDKVTVQYNTLNATSVTVTDARGTARTFTNAYVRGVNKNVALNLPCSGCEAASYGYDANGFFAHKTDFNGNRTNYTHNVRGLEEVRVEGLTSAGAATAVSRRITTEWHGTYRLPTRIAEPLRITTFTYGAATDTNPGNRGSVLTKTIQSTTDATGNAGFGAVLTGSPRTWTYTYTTSGQVWTVNGPRTDVSDLTTYTYYASNATCTATVPGASTTGCRGQLNTISNALAHVTTINEYNAHGQPLKMTDPNGLVTTLAYDVRMRLTSKNVRGQITSYAYNSAGQLQRVTLPGGSYLDHIYDAAHRLKEIKDNVNNRIVYTLDLMGNRTAEDVHDPAGSLAQKRTREFNSLNRLWKDIGAMSQTTVYAYDTQGNLKTIDGPLTVVSDVTTNDYDQLNRLIKGTDAKGGIVEYTYDLRDQLKSVKDPRTLTTAYSPDGLGNLNTQTSPDTGATTNTYDAAGNLRTTTDARGKVATYSYDALNRVISVTFMDTTLNTTYQYDVGANAKGRLSRMTDVSGATEWSYDAWGRVIRKTQRTTTRVHAVEYAYDVHGRLASMIYPSGRVITYAYDSAGRVSQLSLDGTPIMSGITYHPFGQPKSWTWGNNQPHVRTFDQDGRIKTHTLGSATRTITYDAASRITKLDEGTVATTRTFGYDELDRLTSFIYNTTNQGYQYDATGNRTRLTIGASNYTYAYPASSNRLASTTGPAARTYSYDMTGNRTGDGARTWTYDDRGRLKQTTHSTGSNTYQVNGLGQRVTRAGLLFTGMNRDVYDEHGRLIGEYNDEGDELRELVFLGDMPVARLTRGTQEVRVDNTTAGQTTLVGTWTVESVDAGYYLTNYHRKAAGTGTATFTWTPPVPSAQSYRVYVRWTAHVSRATNATYTVYHAGGATTVTVNQRLQGGEWNLLGTFSLAPSSNHRVVLSDNANGVVVADAVKIVPAALAASVSYIHTDHLNTPLRIVNQSNQLRWTWDPAPFGETAANENPSGLGTFTFRQRFPGQFYDAESGTYYNYFRDYDPGIGRYMQSDPIWLRGGLNLYSYVHNNPLRSGDPFGLAASGGSVSTRYGNWCGRNWSGGQSGPQLPTNPAGPIDSVDECCMGHDYCYAKYECTGCMSSGDRSKGKKVCDDTFVDCLDRLSGKAPQNWPKPPPAGTETAAYMFCQKAKWWFR
jgi:RHS repeat-associated protein